MSLPKFEGKEVRTSTVRITGAGDGLSDALEVDPVALHYGQEMAYVLRTRVQQVNHRPIDAKKPELGLTRQHTLKVEEITAVDGGVAEEFLAEERARIAALKPEEQQALDTEG